MSTLTKEFIKTLPEPTKRKKAHVGAGVDPLVVKRLETLGIDIPRAIEHFLNETAGHYVCPTCNSLLKSLHKKRG